MSSGMQTTRHRFQRTNPKKTRCPDRAAGYTGATGSRPAGSASTMTAVVPSPLRENIVGNALLLGRERRIERLLDRKQLIKALDRRGHAVALDLVALDGRRTLPLRRALRHPGAP